MRLKDLIEMVTEAARNELSGIETTRNLDPAEQHQIARKVGLAAIKYADLSNHRTSDYLFDLERFTSFRGRTGPYILYSAVRIKSILRRATEQGIVPGELLPPSAPDERALMLVVSQFSDALSRALEQRAPNHLCEYAYTLAFAVNRFYNACHILGETNRARQAAWLALSQLCLRQLEQVSSLLGMEIPERM